MSGMKITMNGEVKATAHVEISPLTKLTAIDEDFNVYDWNSGEARFLTNDRADGWNGNLKSLRSLLICIDHELIHLNRRIRELEKRLQK